MSNDVWDMDEGGSGEVKKLRPLFTLGPKVKNDQALHKWATAAKTLAVGKSRNRVKDIKRHIELYSGTHHQSVGSVEERARSQSSVFSRGTTARSPSTARVTVNHLYSLTENLVSRITRFKPTISVVPANSDEVSDRNAASLVKELVDYISYTNNFDEIMRQISRRRYIAGESYLYIGWDPRKGPLHPEVEKLSKTSKGKPSLKDDTGNSRELDEDEKYIGDVCFRIPQTYNIYLQPQPDGHFEDVEWIVEKSYVDEDVLKKRYPKKAKDIKGGGANAIEDDEDVDMNIGREIYGNLENELVVYELWHKKTQYLPEGRHIVFTEDAVLLNEEHPYDHGLLPYIRITNIDVDGRLYGESIFMHTKQLNNLINNLYSMIYRNQALVGHPKWIIPKGAKVKTESLANEITAITYEGPVPPQLAVFQNTPVEMWNLAQDLTERMQQVMGVFGVSRGEPPPGIKAGVALQFLNEQENELFNNDVNKHNAVIKQIWLTVLELVKQYYDDSDERIVRIFGENKEYRAKTFDVTALNTPFDVRVQNSSALPNSKAARTQYIMDIDERKPMPDEVFYEYVDLGVPDAFINEQTKAKRSADIENKEMSDGASPPEPDEWEDQLAHWHSHMTYMQGKDFKEASDQIRTSHKDHLRAHEMIMMGKAFFNDDITQVKNPAMAEALASMPNFPAVYTAPPPPPPPPPEPPPIPEGPPMPPGGPMMAPPMDPNLALPMLPVDPLAGAPMEEPPILVPPGPLPPV